MNRVPVPITAQWSEARGFVRLYHNNPHYQARLAMALCGLRAEAIYEDKAEEPNERVSIIESAILEFSEMHPEFLSPHKETDSEVGLGPYEPDLTLIDHIEQIRQENAGR